MKAKPNTILDVAERLFADNGYGATSTRTIATLSKVNIAMLSYYFGSKEGVFDATLKRRSKQLNERINQSINIEIAPVHQLMRYLEAMAEFMAVQHPAFLALLARELAGSQPTVLAEAIARHTESHRQMLGLILEAGGEVFRETDPDRGYALILAVLAACAAWPALGARQAGGAPSTAVAILMRVFLGSTSVALEAQEDKFVPAPSVPPPAPPPPRVDDSSDGFGIGMID